MRFEEFWEENKPLPGTKTTKSVVENAYYKGRESGIIDCDDCRMPMLKGGLGLMENVILTKTVNSILNNGSEVFDVRYAKNADIYLCKVCDRIKINVKVDSHNECA